MSKGDKSTDLFVIRSAIQCTAISLSLMRFKMFDYLKIDLNIKTFIYFNRNTFKKIPLTLNYVDFLI